MRHSPDTLNGEQRKILADIVAIPSWVDAEKGVSEREVLEYIEAQFKNTDCTVRRMEVIPDTLWNLVVEKGKGPYNLYLVGHVDTIRPDWEQAQLKLRIDTDGDTISGLGVWDMKAGIMGMMDVMRRVNVPSGIKVTALFLVDEEYESQGANKVIENMQADTWKDVIRLQAPDLAFSPEISNLDENTALQYTPLGIARGGHIKTTLRIQTKSGHAGMTDLPDATNELAVVMAAMIADMEAIQKNATYDIFHPPEKLRFGDWYTFTKGNMFSTIPQAETAISHMPNYPMTVERSLAWQRAIVEDIADRRNYAQRGIEYILSSAHKRTNYAPFVLHKNALFVTQVADLIDKLGQDSARKHVKVGDRSTSDANLFVAKGWKYLESGPWGRDAHNKDERTSMKSIAMNIKLMEALIKGEHLA